jgi:hypothetical protein
VNLEALQTTHAIIGWRNATTLLFGDEAISYGDVDYSGLMSLPLH